MPFPVALSGGAVVFRLLAVRGVAEALSVYLYLRGGALLVWWWDLLLQSRHLLNLVSQ